MMLGPRLGRYADGLDPLPLGNPVNACMGLFVLWWGWLAFNSGSTYGVSGAKWQYAARAAVMTMMGCNYSIYDFAYILHSIFENLFLNLPCLLQRLVVDASVYCMYKII